MLLEFPLTWDNFFRVQRLPITQSLIGTPEESEMKNSKILLWMN